MSLPVDGNLDFQSVNKIVNLPAPTAAGDAVNKSYADALAQGVIFLAAVQAASVGANVSLAAPGAALDGVVLAAGNRILLKDQTIGSQNGVWVWNGAAAALTRPTDFASTTVHHPGTTVFVEGGTAGGNLDALFTLIATADVTVDTTTEVWSQTNGTADITVQAPITKSGNQIQLNNGNPLPVTNGGTGSATAGGARTNLGAVGKYAGTIGDGSSTSIAVVHNLGTTDVQVQVFDMATGSLELVQTVVNSNNQVTVGPFGTAPAVAGGAIGSGTGKRVVVMG